MPDPFKHSQRPKIARSVFDLSHEHKLTCNLGELIPIMNIALVPGDIFQVAHNLVIRFQPLNAPVMHEVNAYIETFFVPYRILWDDWEDFITGGEDGTSAPTLPVWSINLNEGDLGDYLNFPIDVAAAVSGRPLDFPLRAYNLIWNEYYRDETQQTALTIGGNTTLQLRNWEKDYFTSALPWEQRGTAPAFPISGVIDVDGAAQDIQMTSSTDGTDRVWVAGNNNNTPSNYLNGTTAGNMRWGTDLGLSVDLSAGVTVSVNDQRLAFQMQKLLERAATGGARYTEWLYSMFGVTNGDARLQRPEWIGGMRVPVIFSEVLQTSEDGSTPQGNMAGHGITAGAKRIGTYRAKEFGVLMSIMSIMPKPAYHQGIDRDWLKSTRWDFYNPLLANLGEQAVTHAELYTSATQADNESVFGYQGRFNEMRSKENMVSGEFHPGETYEYWTMCRDFSSKPSLNSSFLEYDGITRIFAAPAEPGLLINAGNIVKAVRPMPVMPNPGYIDH